MIQLFVWSLSIQSARAESPDESAAPEEAEPDDLGVPFALSVGTGPRPLNSLTLGLTGLAARALFPSEVVTPFVGLSITLGSVAAFDDGDREDAEVTGLTALSLSGGIRYDLVEHDETFVVPYLIAGLHGTRLGARVGEPGAFDRAAFNEVGLFSSLGLDGFVTPHLSLGAEIGGFVAFEFGSDRDEDGDVNTRHQVVFLTATTALQVTVWR